MLTSEEFYRARAPEGFRALQAGDTRLAANKFLEAFHAAPSKWDSGRFVLLTNYLAVLEVNAIRGRNSGIPVLQQSDFDALRDIKKDKAEPCFYRAWSASTLAKLHMTDINGEGILEAGGLFHSALKLAFRADENELSRKVLTFLPNHPGNLIERQLGELLLPFREHLRGEANDLREPRATDVRLCLEHFPEFDLGRFCAGAFFCDGCKTPTDEPYKDLKECSRCQKAYYCSETCQTICWNNGHEEACRKPDEIREGDYMQLVCLQSQPDLNQCLVKVIRKDGDRWQVMPNKNDILVVSSDKLVHIRPAK